MKVLVCGDRNWKDEAKIEDRIQEIWDAVDNPDKVIILHGGAKGADSIAGFLAEDKYGFTVKAFPADWTKHGKSAGPIRNRQMLDEEPDLVIAFHSNIKN
jgi:hypothetical protein